MKGGWMLAETAGLFAADQIIKTCAEQKLDLNEERKAGSKIRIRRVHNYGMAFGFLSDQTEPVRWFSLLAAGAVTGIQILELFLGRGFLGKAAAGMLSAGAWSNTFDRFARGYVVDYIGFSVKNEKAGKLTYNLGDFLIAAGVLLLGVRSLFRKEKGSAGAWKKTEK